LSKTILGKGGRLVAFSPLCRQTRIICLVFRSKACDPFRLSGRFPLLFGADRGGAAAFAGRRSGPTRESASSSALRRGSKRVCWGAPVRIERSERRRPALDSQHAARTWRRNTRDTLGAPARRIPPQPAVERRYCSAAPGSANHCARGSRTSVTSAPPSRRTR
jgi:hypothetical protein